MLTEIWLPVRIDDCDYTGFYEISNLGRVRSIDRIIAECRNRKHKGRIMKSSKDKDGYHKVALCKPGHERKYFIHRLVATMFIPNPENLPEVNHKGGKDDNSVDMLEWCSSAANKADAKNRGFYKKPKGKDSHMFNKYPGLKNHYATRVKSTITNEEMTVKEAAQKSGFSRSHLSSMLSGRYPNKTQFQLV